MRKTGKNKKSTVKGAAKGTVQQLKPTVKRTVKKAPFQRFPNGSATVKSTVDSAKTGGVGAIKEKNNKFPPQNKPLEKNKKFPIQEIPPAGSSLDIFNYANENLKGHEGKRGFELFQVYRDFFVRLISEIGKNIPFPRDAAHYGLIDDFQLVDPAYMDNFLLCLVIKLKAPETYDGMLKIIDRRIKPKKQNEGLNSLYQACGGFLALLLQHYEGVSRRQALRAAAQLTGYSESTVEKPLIRMKAMRKKLKDGLPPPVMVAVLYWTLHQKGVNPDTLEPFRKKSPRSQGAAQKAINGYRQLTEKITRKCQNDILQYQQKNRTDIFSRIATDFGFTFPLAEPDMKKIPAYTVLITAMGAMMVTEMPEIIPKIEEMARDAL